MDPAPSSNSQLGSVISSDKMPVRPVLRDLNSLEASGKSSKRNSLTSSSTPAKGSSGSSSGGAVSAAAADAISDSGADSGLLVVSSGASPLSLPDIVSNAQHIKENQNDSLSDFVNRFHKLGVQTPGNKVVDNRLLSAPAIDQLRAASGSHTSSDDEAFVECDSFADESALLRGDTVCLGSHEDLAAILNDTELLEDTRVLTPATSTDGLNTEPVEKQEEDTLEDKEEQTYEEQQDAERHNPVEPAPVEDGSLNETANVKHSPIAMQQPHNASNRQSFDSYGPSGTGDSSLFRTFGDATVVSSNLNATASIDPADSLGERLSSDYSQANVSQAEQNVTANIDYRPLEDGFKAEHEMIGAVNEADQTVDIVKPDDEQLNLTAAISDQTVEVIEAADIEQATDGSIELNRTPEDVAAVAMPKPVALIPPRHVAEQQQDYLEAEAEVTRATSPSFAGTEDVMVVLNPFAGRVSAASSNRLSRRMSSASSSSRVSSVNGGSSESINSIGAGGGVQSTGEEAPIGNGPTDDAMYEDIDVSMQELPPPTNAAAADQTMDMDIEEEEEEEVHVVEEEAAQPDDGFDLPPSTSEPPPFQRDLAAPSAANAELVGSPNVRYSELTTRTSQVNVQRRGDFGDFDRQFDGDNKILPSAEFEQALWSRAAAPQQQPQPFFAPTRRSSAEPANATASAASSAPDSGCYNQQATTAPPASRESLLLRFDPLLGRPTVEPTGPHRSNQQLLATTIIEEQPQAPAEQSLTSPAAVAEHSFQARPTEEEDEYCMNATLQLTSEDKANENSVRGEGSATPAKQTVTSAASASTAAITSTTGEQKVVASVTGDEAAAAAEVEEEELEVSAASAGLAEATPTTSGGSRQASRSGNRSHITTHRGDAKMSVGLIQDMKTSDDSGDVKQQSFVSSNNSEEKSDAEMAEEMLTGDDVERKLKEAEQRDEALVRRISEKDKTISKMNGVMEAYETTIAELVAEKEHLVKTYTAQKAELKSDRDANFHHLTSLEATFSDLHAKYERSKQLTAQLKANEDTIIADKVKYMDLVKAQEQRYEKMKQHAIAQLEIANNKLEVMTRTHHTDIAKYRMNLKREEISRTAMQDMLSQKTKENQELMKICDELISAQGS